MRPNNTKSITVANFMDNFDQECDTILSELYENNQSVKEDLGKWRKDLKRGLTSWFLSRWNQVVGMQVDPGLPRRILKTVITGE